MRANSVRANFIYNSFFQLINILAPLVTIPYLSRVLGASGVGEYSFTYSIANWFVLLGLLGLSRYGSREIALVQNDKHELSRQFAALYAIQIMATAVSVVCYCFILVFCEPYYRVYLLIWLIWVCSNLFDVSWFFFGIEDFRLTAIRSSLVKIATIVCIFLFVKNPNDIALYCMITAVGNLLAALILWPFLFKHVILRRPDMSLVQKHMGPCIRLFIPVVATSLYTILDKVILGCLAPAQQLGYFEYAEKVSKVPLAFITALGTVMLPRISNELAMGKRDRAENYLTKSMNFTIMMSLAFAFGIAAVAPEFVPIFFGIDFIPAMPMVCLLASIIPIIAWSNVVGVQYLLPQRKDNAYTLSVCIGAIVNIVMNFALIPIYQGMGAAVATLGAELAVLLVQLCFVRNWKFVFSGLKTLIPFLLIGCATYYSVRFFSGMFAEGVFGLVVEISIGIIVYALLTVIVLLVYKWIKIRKQNDQDTK